MGFSHAQIVRIPSGTITPTVSFSRQQFIFTRPAPVQGPISYCRVFIQCSFAVGRLSGDWARWRAHEPLDNDCVVRRRRLALNRCRETSGLNAFHRVRDECKFVQSLL